MLALGWRVPDERKIYATARSAYYAIAKKLVIAKYPPELDAFDTYVPDDMTGERADRLRARSAALFFTDNNFDERKWRRVVSRLARFLMYVDKRRGLAALVAERNTGMLPAEEHALMQRDFETAERDADRLLAQAAALREEIRRRQDIKKS